MGKRSVKSLTGYVGTPRIMGILEKTEKKYGLGVAGLFATLFEGGFRISEVVENQKASTGLTRGQIKVKGEDMIFDEVVVLKKYEKIGAAWTCNGTLEIDKEGDEEPRPCKDPKFWIGKGRHKHWNTERVTTMRRTTLVPLWEEPTRFIIRYLDTFTGGPQSYLWTIPRDSAYHYAHSVDPEIWLHWFRGERASQLSAEYSWPIQDIIKFFMWEDMKMAMHYASMNTREQKKRFEGTRKELLQREVD